MAYEYLTTLNEFVQTVVSEAQQIARTQTSIRLDDFEKQLVQNLSRRYEVSPQSISKIYGPFHWSLFCGAISSPKDPNASPLEIVSGSADYSKGVPLASYYVGHRNGSSKGNFEDLSLGISEKYGGIIAGRMSNELHDKIIVITDTI